MTFSNEKMDKEQMISALNRLNEKLHSSDETGEMILFGGAVMCLVFGSRGYTRDIDAVFEPKGNIYSYAQEVAEEEGLPSNWLNDGVKGWLYVEPETTLVMQLSHLKVLAAKPEYILAMKCYAARLDTDDLNDAKVLVKHLGLTDRNQVLDIRLAQVESAPTCLSDHRHLAYCAAGVHKLCREYELNLPGWVKDKSLILDKPYFPGATTDLLKLVCLVESPPEFKMRNIFTTENVLSRT